jgi:histidinol-phosphatase (PHP family)
MLMRDVHVHFLHGHGGGYTKEFFEGFIELAASRGLDEIYLLEHTHQFIEFEKVYAPVKAYNGFQRDWICRKMNGSIDQYLKFIETVRYNNYPVKVKFGLEVCYIPETAEILSNRLDEYDFDFLTGSVHWIDGWGFDHGNQREIWGTVDVNKTYWRYYEIMCELVETNLFTGLAHPDSIKCFGYMPDFDLTENYVTLAGLLHKNGVYAENSGGLRLNYNPNFELGLNRQLLDLFKQNDVTVYSASDAHKQCDVGANILELERMIEM